MPYTPDPTDATQPTTDKFVESAAEEFRALKVRVNALASTIGGGSGGTGGTSPFVNVRDHGVDPTGLVSSDAGFNAAAAVSGFVYVPAGTYKIDAPISNSATWWLAPNAAITGLTVANNGLMDLSRLTGKIVHYDNSPYRTARFGSPKDWLEKDYWRFSQSIAEVSAVASYSEIGLLGASRTSDNPAQTMGSIGVAAYSVNDSTSPKEPAWGMYINYQKVPGSGPSYGMEIDNVNKSGTFNYTPYTQGDGLTSDRSFNLWLTCGAGDGMNGAGNPVSAALGVAANPTRFNRGIVFTAESVNSSINEVFTTYNGSRVAWYDAQGGTERLASWISSAGAVAGLDFAVRDQATNLVDEGIRIDGSVLAMRPFKSSTLSLGTSSSKWKDVWFTNLRATTQGAVNYSLEENYSGTFGYYFSFRKDASNTWMNMYPDGTIALSGNSSTGNKLIVWPDGSIFAGHSTPTQAGFMVPDGGKFWLNGATKTSYITQSGGSIILVKNGVAVATW